ncbi:hypothetical protein [Kitasatospora herbaricolor]|uniref:hypothetical protein n=1 Tax=Kitasatospora herbaricolor TaxID=68217 RepID=UPI0036DF429C
MSPGRSKTIEITGFVDLEQVEPIYLDTTYGESHREQHLSAEVLRDTLDGPSASSGLRRHEPT